VKQLIITSQINLHRPGLSDQAVLAIHDATPVSRKTRKSLGWRVNLIDLVPAVMTHVSINVSYVLDRKNRMKDFAKLIQSSGFLAPLSLDPATAATARAIGSVADQLLGTFLGGDKERKKILSFRGDFNLITDDLRDGYYVILGTQDKSSLLPRPLPTAEELAITASELLYNGKPIERWSYIVLEVIHIPARTRAKAGGTAWDKLFRQAEDHAQQFSFLPRTNKTQRQNAMDQCLKLVVKGQALLSADSNYLHSESMAIVASVQKLCENYILGGGQTTTTGEAEADRTDTSLIEPYRSALGLDVGEGFDRLLDDYSRNVEKAQSLFDMHRI
jgi:hypothetical protein